MMQIVTHSTHVTARRQAGDTIVEVIVAVAVIALVLAGAFTVTSSSAHNVRDSEEHAQALQYLQGQVELLRSASAVSGSLPTTALNVPFCLVSVPAQTPPTSYYPSSNPNCLVGTGAVSYQLSISSSAATPVALPDTTTFNLSATWPGINGGTDTALLSYKVAVTP